MVKSALIGLFCAMGAACASPPPWDRPAPALVPDTELRESESTFTGPIDPGNRILQITVREFTIRIHAFKTYPNADPPRATLALVTISKADPSAGLVELRDITSEGYYIGGGPKKAGRPGQRRVYSKSLDKEVTVDFETEIFVQRIEAGKRIEYASRRCPILDRPAEKCPGPEVRYLSFTVNQVTLLVDGRTVTLQQPTEMLPIPDALCAEHAGKSVPQGFRDEDQKTVMAWEAAIHLQLADEFWQSRNPYVRKRGKEMYVRLLEVFADQEIVKSNLDRITDRSKANVDD